MGITQNNIPQLKELVTEMNRTHMSLGEHSNEMITLFLSFDIVNSTYYKSLEKEKWSITISAIMRRIISTFSNNPSGGYDFWKTLGDEIIYTRKIGTVQDLLDALEEIYNDLVLLNQKIREGELFQGPATEILSLKAAVWLADLSASHEQTNNVLAYYQINDKRRQADYIGPDIDTGFRASCFSMSNRMVISFDIGCLLIKNQEMLYAQGGLAAFDFSERVHLLTRVELKGVWNGVPYPVLMYHGDINVAFDDSITEYEKENKPIMKVYLEEKEHRQEALLPEYTCYQEQVLKQLCQELNLDIKIQQLTELMEQTGSVSNQDVKELKRVRYVTVCYCMEEDQISFVLVKNKATGLWGFGAAEFFYNDQFVAQTEKGYSEGLGLNISIENDSHYHARIPLVVSCSEFSEDYKNYISRTVFLGRVTQELPAVRDTDIFQLRLISERDIELFEEERIPLFKEILQLCASKIRELDWIKHATRVTELK